MLQEIITEWTTPSGGGHLSIMYFNAVDPIADNRADLAAFLGSIDGDLSDSVSWAIRQEGRVIDPADGVATEFWTDPTSYTGTGSVSVGPVPDAAQVLIRWQTDSVVRGRRVQGRTFIPGLPQNLVVGGNVASLVQAEFADAAATFAGSSLLNVWSRPTDTEPGSQHDVVGGSCWSEMAVQRGRRG
jgi:hypothetical protein